MIYDFVKNFNSFSINKNTLNNDKSISTEFLVLITESSNF